MTPAHTHSSNLPLLLLLLLVLLRHASPPLLLLLLLLLGFSSSLVGVRSSGVHEYVRVQQTGCCGSTLKLLQYICITRTSKQQSRSRCPYCIGLRKADTHAPTMLPPALAAAPK